MKGFVRKIVWFVLLLIVPMAAIYVVCYFQKEKKNSVDTIYVWGDSQMVQGLDLTLVSSCLSRQVLSLQGMLVAYMTFWLVLNIFPKAQHVLSNFPNRLFFARLDWIIIGQVWNCIAFGR